MVRDSSGQTVLHLAVKSGSKDIVKYITENGESVPDGCPAATAAQQRRCSLLDWHRKGWSLDPPSLPLLFAPSCHVQGPYSLLLDLLHSFPSLHHVISLLGFSLLNIRPGSASIRLMCCCPWLCGDYMKKLRTGSGLLCSVRF